MPKVSAGRQQDSSLVASAGSHSQSPFAPGTEGCNEEHESEDVNSVTHVLKHTRVLGKGEVIDLTPAIQLNEDYFTDGPGYDALD